VDLSRETLAAKKIAYEAGRGWAEDGMVENVRERGRHRYIGRRHTRIAKNNGITIQYFELIDKSVGLDISICVILQLKYSLKLRMACKKVSCVSKI
jgi:hypothetical protein